MSPSPRNDGRRNGGADHGDPVDRLDELLLDQALFGLDAAELDELRHIASHNDIGEDLDLVAAATSAALLAPHLEAPPAEVRARMEGMALHYLATDHDLRCRTIAEALESADRASGSTGAAAPLPMPRRPERQIAQDLGRVPARRFGWTQAVAVAATCLAALLLLDRLLDTTVDRQPDWQQLLQRASTTKLSWVPLLETPEPPSGELVWDAEAQQGLMKFENLPPSAGADFQYQLWIFDRNRPKETPIDGGLFDVATTGEVVVHIDARLPVSDAFAFVVTREARGGVVVSKRDVLVTAAGDLKSL